MFYKFPVLTEVIALIGKLTNKTVQLKIFLFLQENPEEAQEELPRKVKFFYSAAVQNWDAEFYLKVDDGIDLDLEALIGLPESRRGQDGAYVGCMKSRDMISEQFVYTQLSSVCVIEHYELL